MPHIQSIGNDCLKQTKGYNTMRQVTKNAVNAFKANGKFCGSNTNVINYPSGSEMLLHMNIIATSLKRTGEVSISLSGWNTVTTRERLNGILKAYNREYGIVQRNHEPYLYWTFKMPSGKLVANKIKLDDCRFYTLAELDAMTNLYDAENVLSV